MAEDGRELAAAVGPLGLWTAQFEGQQFGQVRSAVAALEGRGWPALWLIEAVGREALSQAALLLDATERMVVATGIANVWARDPMALAAARNTIAEAHPGRFVLGLGASHGPLVGLRGHEYRRPLARMRVDAAPVQGAIAGAQPPRVLAALGPRMLELAAERAAGALTYLVTPEHTRTARSSIGSSPALCVEQAVTLTDDVEEARRIGRAHLEVYLGFPNYVNNWMRLGFTDNDVAGGGSDRLVDAMVVAGNVERVAERVREHHDAGADHVCLQVLPADASAMPEQEWTDLASLLPGKDLDPPGPRPASGRAVRARCGGRSGSEGGRSDRMAAYQGRWPVARGRSNTVFSAGFFADEGWDFAVRIALGQCASGATDAGEVLATIARIKNTSSWVAEWSARADQLQGTAEQRAQDGDERGAAAAFLRAASYWSLALDGLTGQEDSERLTTTFRAHRASWERFVDCSGGRHERVAVPYEDTTLPGWLLRPDDSGTPRPTLVMTNGSDGAISSLWGSGAAAALERGWNAFVYDGPGQQSMLFERGVGFRHDWEAVLTPVVDTLVARDDVDADRLTAYGISQAGYWLPRALAFEHRFVAAVADPGVVDVSTSWTAHLPQNMVGMLDKGERDKFDRNIRLALLVPSLARTLRFRARPYQHDDWFDTFTETRRYRITEELARAIRTPLMITDPEDEQFWPGQPEKLADLVPGSHRVTFLAAEGANWHCQPMARLLTHERMFAWLDQQLAAARA